MDATNLKYTDNYFDVVLDKGTLDALIVKFMKVNINKFSVLKI